VIVVGEMPADPAIDSSIRHPIDLLSFYRLAAGE
jgi:hypothetical protein